MNFQQTAAQILVEVCKSDTGDDVDLIGILQLLSRNLMSASPMLRHSSLEGLHALIDVFPEEGSGDRETIASKILLSKYDVSQNTRELAEMYVSLLLFYRALPSSSIEIIIYHLNAFSCWVIRPAYITAYFKHYYHD